MDTRYLFIAVFIAGVTSGWLGKTWMAHRQADLITSVAEAQVRQDAGTSDNNLSANSIEAVDSTLTGANDAGSENISRIYTQEEQRLFGERPSGTSISVVFEKLLDDRLYYDAIVLYQEQFQQDEQTQLKSILVSRLNTLSETRNNSDFSELIENYLSIYYDDIDVLLLLADFNQTNGSYLEVVDVYLLAKTYAYTDVDQQNLLARFDTFVKGIDSRYTNQKNWLSLISLYSHISASGLMTSTYQYQQALAYLRSGDEYSAVEQFKLLVNDSLVGESAAIALNKLTGNIETTAAIQSSVWEGSESIALEQLGNQYLVNLTVNRRDDIKLLIDTGASITTLSRSSFNALTTTSDVVEQDRRVFRTASGVVMGTVYSVSELGLGPYLLKNTRIAVLDFDVSRDIDGLLGMNVLGQFRFQIDQENTRLLLSRE